MSTNAARNTQHTDTQAHTLATVRSDKGYRKVAGFAGYAPTTGLLTLVEARTVIAHQAQVIAFAQGKRVTGKGARVVDGVLKLVTGERDGKAREFGMMLGKAQTFAAHMDALKAWVHEQDQADTAKPAPKPAPAKAAAPAPVKSVKHTNGSKRQQKRNENVGTSKPKHASSKRTPARPTEAQATYTPAEVDTIVKNAVELAVRDAIAALTK
jgi:hypothetical protein